ncbi:transcription factor bHLH121-like [Punica granatum]|uniref:BHLH domain-containing protein n=2 Tax=Punica granatum TaxID=22663 RepID=A0A218XUZ0_PUNGR|nr:transcription factor bHLH121-like [Punica granatum]OWM88975.1 hypothetical protein CDL15_Pgr020929 [Punica granatum]PKI63108.1 hypothetical protein CRG98_016510 [Punica granatum]
MDQWKTDLGPSTSSHQPQPTRLHNSQAEQPRQGPAVEVKDPIAARKVQKADREKLRRDRLNEHFLELGNALDPDRPKNDKATILTDTIQVLRDLTAEVTKLKAEYAALSEESRELMQEKNELREEKVSLKTDIENLNTQYQQRVRVTYPWATIDPSLVMAPTYPYPVPLPVHQGPIPIHPSLQPFPFFGNQNPAPCSTYIPYPAPAHPTVEPHSVHYASSSHVSSKLDSKSKSSEHHRGSNPDRTDDLNDVATELELKMPGSSSTQQDLGSDERKGKQTRRKDKTVVTDGSSSSRFSSSQALQDSSSTSVGDIPRPSK